MICRLIAPHWLMEESPNIPRVLEGIFSEVELQKHNKTGYNIYYLPNHPKEYNGEKVDGSQINVFNYVFVDFDLKSNTYESKDAFLEVVQSIEELPPNKIVDSGNGIHVYWKVADLDAKSYLRLSRRLIRLFDTDEAVGKIFQLMRVTGYNNTKVKNEPKMCELLYENETYEYTCEELDKILPDLNKEDEIYCVNHYDKTYNQKSTLSDYDSKMPDKFGALLRSSREVQKIFTGTTTDRSKNDFYLGRLLKDNRFTKDEAIRVLMNTAKAEERAPHHRYSYAENIVNSFYDSVEKTNAKSPTVRDYLKGNEEELKGKRFECHKLVDDTEHGFRLGHAIGVVGGSGVGKTTLTLNMFLWFAERNPEYHHFFFSLEQPPGEIANRIRVICQDNDSLYDRIHIVSNYDTDGTCRNYSLDDIQDHLLAYKEETKNNIGTTVIDHIGVLSKDDKNGEQNGLIGICRKMKAVAVKVNTLLIMLSQAPREKAGIGDLELNKDAAYGTVSFESFLDFLICMWQPLKRVYSQGAPTIMAFKFAKIRHKKQGKDRIQEDIRYQLYFDANTERLRELTEDEETSAKHWQGRAIIDRKRDKKTDLVPYESRKIGDTNEKP